MRRAAACSLALSAALAGCATDQSTRETIAPVAKADRSATVAAAFAAFPEGGDAKVRTLYDNVDAWAERWRLTESATKTIDCVVFIVSADEIGLSFLGLLYEQAQRGVRVRLMVDAAGTLTFSDPKLTVDWLQALDALESAEVWVYNPVANALVAALQKANIVSAMASNHDKILLVDDRAGIAGGRNLADEYFTHPKDDGEGFFDKDVLLVGTAAVLGLKRAFERELHDKAAVPLADHVKKRGVPRDALLVDAVTRMRAALTSAKATKGQLAAATDKPTVDVRGDKAKQPVESMRASLVDDPRFLGALHRPRTTLHDAFVRVLDSCSVASCGSSQINEGLSQLVASAQRRIFIESPYLILSDEGMAALAAASQRGVEIVILTNSPVSSDNALSQAVFLEQFPTLLATIPTLRIFVVGESHNLHGKVAVFDDEVTLVGSYNLDPLSANVNSEVVAAIRSPAFAQETIRSMRARIARKAPHVYEYLIEKDAQGRAVLDEDDAPKVVFGAEQHCDPAKWQELEMLRNALKVRETLSGAPPLL